MMQLLAVGRSLSEARDRPHHYKLVTNGMPKFEAEKAPLERSGMQAAAGERTQTKQAAVSMATETVESRAPGKAAFPRGRWTLPSNPFKSSYQPEPRRSIQGELSLDSVKPVRNDLSDSDLELVPRKVVRFVESKPAYRRAPDGQVRKVTLFARLKARLLRRKSG